MTDEEYIRLRRALDRVERVPETITNAHVPVAFVRLRDIVRDILDNQDHEEVEE